MSKIIVYVTNACMSEVECYEYVMLSITEYSKMSFQFLININTVKTYARLSLSLITLRVRLLLRQKQTTIGYGPRHSFSPDGAVMNLKVFIWLMKK